MKALIQRVTRASVAVDEKIIGEIGAGLAVLLGVTTTDTEKNADALAEKIANLRLFPGGEGKGEFDVSVLDLKLGVLAVSQFTLYGSCNKGRRPDFNDAARPEQAQPLYEYFVAKLKGMGLTVATGKFGADMKVSLVNDGPVTFMIEL